VEKAFHYYLTGQSTGKSCLLAGGQQANGKYDTCRCDTENRAKQFVGVLDLGNVLMARPMKGSGGKDQDGCINKERYREGGDHINGKELYGVAFAFRRPREIARLDYRGVHVEIMRHNCCPKDADRGIEHIGILENIGSGHKTQEHPNHTRLGKKEFRYEANADGGDQGNDQSLYIAEPFALKKK